MDISLIIILIFSVLIFGVVGKAVKWIFKIIGLMFLIGFVLSLVLGFFVYKDLSELKQNWPDSNKLVLLANDKVYAGMITTFSGDEEPVLIENVEDYQIAYQNKDYQTILGSNYKLFIFKLSMFEKDEEIDFGDKKISQDMVINAIENDNASKFIGESEQTEIKNGAEINGMLFGLLLQSELTKDPLFIFKQYSKGNVVIYPETITFKLIKAVPFSLIEGIAKQVISKTEERLSQ